MKIKSLAILLALPVLAFGQIEVNPPGVSPANSNLTGSTTVETLTVSGSTSANGNTTLGDASGDSLTINAGTVTAPNVTNLSLPAQTNADANSVFTRTLTDDWRIDPATQFFRDDFANGGRTTGSVGETGWSFGSSGAGATVVERGNAGVPPNHTSFRFTTGTTSTNNIRVSTANPINVGSMAAFTSWSLTMIFAPVQTTNCLIVIALSNNPTSDYNDRGIGVRFLAGTDTNYQFFTKNDTAGFASTTLTTLVDSGVAPVANTFVKVEIRCVTAGTIEFRINGSSWVASSTNIPTSGNTCVFLYAETRAAASASLDVDFIAWKKTLTDR